VEGYESTGENLTKKILGLEKELEEVQEEITKKKRRSMAPRRTRCCS